MFAKKKKVSRGRLFFVGLVLENNGEKLPRGAGAAVPVDEVRKDLLRLAELKTDMIAVRREHVEVCRSTARGATHLIWGRSESEGPTAHARHPPW